jgi:hypothetical protein
VLTSARGMNRPPWRRFNRKQRFSMCLLNAHSPPIFVIVQAHRYRIGIPMLGELRSPPTNTLLDIVFVILVGGPPLTLSEVGELEQIHRELQRRGELEGARLCQTAIGWRAYDSSNLTPMISSTAIRMLGTLSIKSPC